MEIIENRGSSPDSRIVERAVEALRNGKVIIYPTDTLYALGCDALNARAIEKLCRIKGINPEKNVLSIVCSDLSQAASYARIDNRIYRLIKTYLPGPFTFILPASTSLPKVFKGRKSVGIRIPDCEMARAIAREMDGPILSSSVVLDCEDEIVNPATLALEYEGFSDIELTIDSGNGSTIPSTIIDCTKNGNPELIRQGAGVFDE